MGIFTAPQPTLGLADMTNASFSEAVKVDVRMLMSPPQRQSIAQISGELGIRLVTFYNWRKVWRMQGEVVPASQKEPEGWTATDK